MSTFNLTEAIQSLAREAEPILNQHIFYTSTEFWIKESKGPTSASYSQKFENIVDISTTVFRASSDIEKTVSYQHLAKYFSNNEALKNSSQYAGYWGVFDVIFSRILQKSILLHDNKITVNEHIMESLWLETIAAYEDFNVTTECEIAIIGVVSNLSSFSLPNGLDLTFLNIKEHSPDKLTRGEMEELRSSNNLKPYLIVKFSIKTKIKEKKDNIYFEVERIAQESASTIVHNLINCILLSMPCGAYPFYTKTSNKLTHPTTRYHNHKRSGFPKVEIDLPQMDRIKRAWRILSESKHDDEVLIRSLSRFFLSKNRTTEYDRIVDLTIAFESILLTSNGSSAHEELSYRFRLNSSALVKRFHLKMPRIDTFSFFKSVYDVRSKLVHGGSEDEVQKILKKAALLNLGELIIKLESFYTTMFFCLIDIPKTDRPYHKVNGWEEILLGD